MSFKSVMSEGGDAAAAILAEAEEWREIMALDAEKVLDVYLDMKGIDTLTAAVARIGS